jgi:hypothetical protein
MRGALLDDDLFAEELEENWCRRTGLWISCIFVMLAVIIGGIILILWNCGVLFSPGA